MSIFNFKHFQLHQSNSLLKVGTDAMLLGALVEANSETKSILDIGTGTGVLALMLAQRFANAKIDAIEIDSKSCLDAKQNFEASIWFNRLNLIQSDVLTYQFNQKYDLIVSNPPYYEQAYFDEQKKEHTAKHSELGLSLIRLFDVVLMNLIDNGVFWVILPSDNFSKWTEYLNLKGLFVNNQINIYGKPQNLKRVVACFSRINIGLQITNFTIRDENGNYTEAYRNLTIDYHHTKI